MQICCISSFPLSSFIYVSSIYSNKKGYIIIFNNIDRDSDKFAIGEKIYTRAHNDIRAVKYKISKNLFSFFIEKKIKNIRTNLNDTPILGKPLDSNNPVTKSIRIKISKQIKIK